MTNMEKLSEKLGLLEAENANGFAYRNLDEHVTEEHIPVGEASVSREMDAASHHI